MGNSSSKSVDENEASKHVAGLQSLLQKLDDQEDHLQKRVDNKEKEKKFCKQRTKASAKAKRKTFAEISNQLSDCLFCRTYRMSKPTFTKIASVIEECVGDDEFKSELKFRTNKNRTSKATDFRGGEISGETRLAIAIRILSGASYLDLLMVTVYAQVIYTPLSILRSNGRMIHSKFYL